MAIQKKEKSKERTQTMWTLRVDHDNLVWLDAESERTNIAKGRIVNDLIAAAKASGTPELERWKQQRTRLMEIRETLKQAIIDLYDVATVQDAAIDYDTREPNSTQNN